jgi:hypothetical protein
MGAAGQHVGDFGIGVCQCFRDRDWQFLDTQVDSHLIREVRV